MPQYTIRAGRQGDAYRAAIMLPSRHGEIVVSASVPFAATRELQQYLRAALLSDSVGCGCVGGIADVAQLAHAQGVGGIWETVGPLAQAGISAIPIPGAGLLAQALPALMDLFGAGPPPPRFDPNRPATLPPGGSPENLRRILQFVGVREGMPRDEAARRLSAGRANRWNRTDFDDAEHLEQALEAGPVNVARVVARATPGAPAGVPTAPQPRARMDGPPLPAQASALAQLATGALSAPQASAQMAGNAALLGAAQALRAAPELFEGAPDFAALMRGTLDAADTLIGGELLGVPSLVARLDRSDRAAQSDPRVAEYLRAARGLHSWMHDDAGGVR